MSIYDNIVSCFYSSLYCVISIYHKIEYTIKSNITFCYENNDMFKSCTNNVVVCYNNTMNTCKYETTEYYGNFYGIIFKENFNLRQIIVHDNDINIEKVREFVSMEEIRIYKDYCLYVSIDNAKIVLLNDRCNESELISIFENVQCKPKFLSITYKHPNMDIEGIELTLNKEYMIMNNTLLSNEHVCYLLRHQELPYIFDDKYTLDIMDQKLNTFILNYNQYVVIDENDSIMERENVEDELIT